MTTPGGVGGEVEGKAGGRAVVIGDDGGEASGVTPAVAQQVGFGGEDGVGLAFKLGEFANEAEDGRDVIGRSGPYVQGGIVHGCVIVSPFNYPLQDAAKTKPGGVEAMSMLAYSALLTLGLVLSSPWWLVRMATTQRYREGLRQRLGAVPARLVAAVQGKRVVWVHAVSVGEVLAASQLVGELEAALGDGFRVVISTTTRTGQALARERFGAERVFYMPLDFTFSVGAYLRTLKPAALVLMESELWPRVLSECARGGVPAVVANARMSDRSFARAAKVRWIWGRVMRKPALWLAQSEEDARRLVSVGVRAERMQVAGNMKYDIRAPKLSRIAERIRMVAEGRSIFVAGSTVEGVPAEEELVIGAWKQSLRGETNALLVLAPRHPERFRAVEELLQPFRYVKASVWAEGGDEGESASREIEVVLLDTIGDLAAVYGIADVAFLGGSLIRKGGHNPLEPAQFAVPVVMGPSFENFRDVVTKMQAAGGICIVQDQDELGAAVVELLTDRKRAGAMGEAGRRVFEEQQGATARSVEAIVAMIREARA
jgi:3-deoxy-D-manno-octulosonic-acid transferase